MKVSEYEMMYITTENTMKSGAAIIDSVVEYMSNRQGQQLTCSDIAADIFGERFLNDFYRKSCICEISHMMTRLCKAGYVKRMKIPNGNPIEVEYTKDVRIDNCGREIKITVTAEDGRKFEIVDPDIRNPYDSHWATVTKKKTVQPMKTVFIWG